MTELTTAAGRALYAKHALLLTDEQQTSVDRVPLATRIRFMDDIIAIEAEARADALDEARAAVLMESGPLPTPCDCGPGAAERPYDRNAWFHQVTGMQTRHVGLSDAQKALAAIDALRERSGD